MTPFNYEAAKAGKKVCTRDGRMVRILCFDLKNKSYQIVAAVPDKGGVECVKTYTRDGKVVSNIDMAEADLFMMPEMYSGFIILYPIVEEGRYKWNIDPYIYKTRIEAEEAAKRVYGTCIAKEIEWMDL